MVKQQHAKQLYAKQLYLAGKSITDIATLLGVSRTTIHNYKSKDKARGADWDELRFIKATDSADAIKTEQDFVSLLIHQFERVLTELNDLDLPEQLAEISKHATIYYKIKQQKENPKINKADLAKQVLQEISDIALAKQSTCVIEFLSQHADEVVTAVIS